MSFWTIRVLDYGYIPYDKGAVTPGFDAGLKLITPLMGFLLENGKETVLVDCGVNEQFFANGGGWGGAPTVGGSKLVLESLEKVGKTPDDIDMVIYTHLHNDHAGNCHLFPNATAVYQKAEFENLLNPLPTQRARRDYDMDVIERLAKLSKKLVVDGDIELGNGLRLYIAPGHTKGSQVVLVQTENGPRLIIGDLCNRYYMMFPQMEELVMPDGTVVKITPMPEEVYLGSLTYDHYAFFDSFNKIKALVPEFKPKYFLPGHETSLLYTGVM